MWGFFPYNLKLSPHEPEGGGMWRALCGVWSSGFFLLKADRTVSGVLHVGHANDCIEYTRHSCATQFVGAWIRCALSCG